MSGVLSESGVQRDSNPRDIIYYGSHQKFRGNIVSKPFECDEF